MTRGGQHMGRTAYITLLGASSWALVNSFYALVREGGHVAAHIAIVSGSATGTADIVRALRLIAEAYGEAPNIDVIHVPETDPVAAASIVAREAAGYGGGGMTLALDITSGRKALIAALIMALEKTGCRPAHIYYLSLRCVGETPRPYMMIPRIGQVLCDLGQGVGRS